MKKLIFVSASILTFIACSHKVISTTTSTSSPAPALKSKADAMYASNIKSIFENKCTPCHFPGKGGNKAALDNFEAASSLVDEILERVQLKPGERGYMPFKENKEGLTAAEIVSVKAWKVAIGK